MWMTTTTTRRIEKWMIDMAMRTVYFIVVVTMYLSWLLCLKRRRWVILFLFFINFERITNAMYFCFLINYSLILIQVYRRWIRSREDLSVLHCTINQWKKCKETDLHQFCSRLDIKVPYSRNRGWTWWR